MCEPVMWAMAISGTMTAIKGGDFGDILLSAAISGATAYVGGSLFGEGGSMLAEGAEAYSAFTIGATSATIGSMAGELISPPKAYTAEAYDYNPITFNSQENQVTGSGGSQAAAVLSSEIKRAKVKRAKQAQPKQDSYINTESFANSGLQLA